MMKPSVIGLAALLPLVVGNATTVAADDVKAREGVQQLESGAKQIGKGIEDTAKGIGKTVVRGAETASDRIKEAGKAAEPPAKTAWSKTKDGAVSFGHSVKAFFANLFNNSRAND